MKLSNIHKNSLDTSLIFDVIFMQMKIPTARKGLGISQQNVWRTAIQNLPNRSDFFTISNQLFVFVSGQKCQRSNMIWIDVPLCIDASGFPVSITSIQPPLNYSWSDVKRGTGAHTQPYWSGRPPWIRTINHIGN